MATPSADKAAILSEFWMDFRDDEALKDFVEFNDMGLPLAFFVASGIVQESPMAETYIAETFDLFLIALEITEDEIEGLETLNDVLDYARSKKEGDIN
jgi:hypothetical protein